ncbi:hypothetical protein ACWC4D_33595 [Streptomyces sp. NPDC001288]
MTAPSEPTAHGVRIGASPGHATISIDGTPLPAGQIVGYELQHDIVNGLPMLLLHTRQPEGAVWEGLARVAVAETQQDLGEQIAAFLSGLNPAAVERAALDRDDLGNEKHSVTEAILKTIAGWAQGRGV